MTLFHDRSYEIQTHFTRYQVSAMSEMRYEAQILETTLRLASHKSLGSCAIVGSDFLHQAPRQRHLLHKDMLFWLSGLTIRGRMLAMHE